MRAIDGVVIDAELLGRLGQFAAGQFGGVQLPEVGDRGTAVGFFDRLGRGFPEELGTDDRRLHLVVGAPELGVVGRPRQQVGIGGRRRRIRRQQGVLSAEVGRVPLLRGLVRRRAEIGVIPEAHHDLNLVEEVGQFIGEDDAGDPRVLGKGLLAAERGQDRDLGGVEVIE